MREIKFRAFIKKGTNNISQGNVVDVVYISLDDGTIMFKFLDGEQAALKNDCVLMQYTGLKDKNDVEIYEGDILNLLIPNWTENKEIEKFVINDFYCDVNYLEAVIKHCHECKSNGEIDYVEVIGNIFEHPHLLKGE